MITPMRTVSVTAALSLPTRRGRVRNPLLHLLALEYLLWPGKRPHGLQKSLAYANDLTPGQLNKAVNQIAKAKPNHRTK